MTCCAFRLSSRAITRCSAALRRIGWTTVLSAAVLASAGESHAAEPPVPPASEIMPAPPPDESSAPTARWLRPGLHRRQVEQWVGDGAMVSVIHSLQRAKLTYDDGTELLFFRDRLISLTPGADVRSRSGQLVLLNPTEQTVLIDPVLLRECGLVPLSETLKCQIEHCFIYAPPGGMPLLDPTFMPNVELIREADQPAEPPVDPASREATSPARPSSRGSSR